MTELHGSPDSFLYVDGRDLSGVGTIKGLRLKQGIPTEETTGINDGAEKNSPIGISRNEFAQEGAFFDTETEGMHDAFKNLSPTAQAAARIVCLGFAGESIGDPFYGLEGAFNGEYEVVVPGDVLDKVNATYVVDGEVDEGVILQPMTSLTVDGDTEATPVDRTTELQTVIPITSNSQASPSVVTTAVPHGLTSGDKVFIAGVSDSDADINGEQVATVISTTTFSVPVDASVSAGTGGTMVRADSANGGVGYLQVKALTGWTGITVTLLDSPDDITYVSLGAFAAVTSAPGKERITIAGDVDRYLATSRAFAGGGPGSATVFVGFVRNP